MQKNLSEKKIQIKHLLGFNSQFSFTQSNCFPIYGKPPNLICIANISVTNQEILVKSLDSKEWYFHSYNRICYILEKVKKLMLIFFTSTELNWKYPEFRTKCWMIEPCRISYFMLELLFILIWNKWNYIKIIRAFFKRPRVYFSLNFYKPSSTYVVLLPFSHDTTEAQKRKATHAGSHWWKNDRVRSWRQIWG